MALLEAEPALHRHVADVGGRQVGVGRNAQRVLVGPDALDGAHRARAEPRAGPIGDAEIHRHADERDVEAAASGLRQRIGSERQAEKRGGIRERPFAPLGAGEDLRRDRREFRVVDVAAFGIGIFAAQRVELLAVHDSIVRPAHYTAKPAAPGGLILARAYCRAPRSRCGRACPGHAGRWSASISPTAPGITRYDLRQFVLAARGHDHHGYAAIAGYMQVMP